MQPEARWCNEDMDAADAMVFALLALADLALLVCLRKMRRRRERAERVTRALQLAVRRETPVETEADLPPDVLLRPARQGG